VAGAIKAEAAVAVDEVKEKAEGEASHGQTQSPQGGTRAMS
jgi:hypothetical protein